MKQTLWTIQDRKAYEQFKDTGILRANENFLFCQNDFLYAYDWMSQKMREKIGPPPAAVKYPVWAWYQWEGRRKRMDLRCAGYAERGTELVQIEFEAEENTFLLSDFDDWHFVLSKGYIADSEKEFDDFYSGLQVVKPDEIEKSWEKIFDLERNEPNWRTPVVEKSIQATLWEIDMSQVKKVEFFRAK